MATTLSEIDEFLALRRLARVGVSRDSKDFNRGLFREMCKCGYDMVAVNPPTNEWEAKPCFARLMVSPKERETVVRECAEAGVRHVWMYRDAGQGAVSQAAVSFSKENSIRVVEGYCPLLFLPDTRFFHRVHGLLMKLTGRYPAPHLC